MQNLSKSLNIKRIYFIGIGGISLSALSFIMKKEGFVVAGSDEKQSEITTKLNKSGIKVFIKHKQKNIKNFKPDLVVFSGAIHQDNKELIFAKKMGITCLERPDFIKLILKYYKNVISISGTHGKTTTTSMISEIFLQAKLDPTIHIGGESVNLNSNYHAGSKEFFVNEACEYRKSFLKFNSSIGVILNIEEDHPDSYKNLTEIKNAFFEFSKICNKIVINENYIDIFKNCEHMPNVTTFGTKNADYCAKNIRKLTCGGFSFSVYKNGKFFDRFRIEIFGKHNVLNALCAVCVSDIMNIDKLVIKQALKNFRGVKRRFEKVETKIFDGDVYFDYAHHPTEIKKLLTETKNLNRPIICVFQPHTFSRTQKYFNDFLSSFENTYQTIFYKTYKAREKHIKGADSKDLFVALKQKQNVYYYNNFNKIIKHLKKYSKPNCIVLFVGAGDIYDIKNLII